jgi:hypothetical protein
MIGSIDGVKTEAFGVEEGVIFVDTDGSVGHLRKSDARLIRFRRLGLLGGMR